MIDGDTATISVEIEVIDLKKALNNLVYDSSIYPNKDEYDEEILEKFKNDEDQERFVEIWNNVFSQFNSKEGQSREDYQELLLLCYHEAAQLRYGNR